LDYCTRERESTRLFETSDVPHTTTHRHKSIYSHPTNKQFPSQMAVEPGDPQRRRAAYSRLACIKQYGTTGAH